MHNQQPIDYLLDLVTEAFPIGIFMKQLENGERHIMEIAECIKEDGYGKYRINTLYKYEIDKEIPTESGTIIEGHYTQPNNMSAALQKKLHDNGVPLDVLRSFMTKGAV